MRLSKKLVPQKLFVLLFFAFSGLGLFLLVVNSSEAAPICTVPSGIKFEQGLGLPQIGGYRPDASLPDFIVYVYLLGAGVAGFLALVMMVISGIQYTASQGNPKDQTEAKERIWNALLGLALLLSSYVILSTINRGLIGFSTFKLPSPPAGGTQAGGLCPSQRGNACELKDTETFTAEQTKTQLLGITINSPLEGILGTCENAKISCSGDKPECVIERSYIPNDDRRSAKTQYQYYCCAGSGASSGGGGGGGGSCSPTACENCNKAECLDLQTNGGWCVWPDDVTKCVRL